MQIMQRAWTPSQQSCMPLGLQQEVCFTSDCSCISLLAVLLLLSQGHVLLDGIQTHMVLAALQYHNNGWFLVRIKQSYCHI